MSDSSSDLDDNTNNEAPAAGASYYMDTLGEPARSYWPYLCRVMDFHRFNDVKHYPPKITPKFSDADMNELTPPTIVRWMCLSAFGNPDPLPNDVAIEGRSNSLHVMKKSVSYYLIRT